MIASPMPPLLRAPFPYFGGKRRVADVVWRAFGPDIPNYVEPFFGSGAVLLGRPGGARKIETANDLDRMVANFWRAVQSAPEQVAEWADWPVSEADMHARHAWLVAQLRPGAEFRERMHTEPEYFDAKIAGWWVWGICQWIGGGWCREPRNRKLPSRQRPFINGANAGMGVFSGEAGYSPGRRAQLSGKGQGVHLADNWSHLPSLGNDRAIHGVSAPPCSEWFRALQARLRRVRFANGDWSRVMGDSVLGKGKNVGGRRPCAVFLDPPYDTERRSDDLYAEDAPGLSAQVREWAIAHGDDPELRIALCGYAGEHEMPPSWHEHEWKGHIGYAREEGHIGYAREDNDNRLKERIWFSPHCLALEQQQTNLFEVPR